MGEELSINTTAERDKEGNVLFPPVDKGGLALPFFCEGELRKATNSNPLFDSSQTKVNPNAFGLRDTLRFADVPATHWHKYTSQPHDYPECKQCEHARIASESSNGAQIKCSDEMRPGRFPACWVICLKQKLRIQRGEAKVLKSKQMKALQEEFEKARKRQGKNAEDRNAKQGSRLKRNGKVLPLRRDKAKVQSEVEKKIALPPSPPKPRQGKAPSPRQRRRLLRKDKG